MDKTANSKTKQRGKYQKPPIQEAVCEIHFKLTQPLDKGALARMQAPWRVEYPEQAIVAERLLELHLTLDKLDSSEKETGHKLIARSTDGKNLVQLGPAFMAVNRLAPYIGWDESFRETILQRFREVHSLFQFEKIQRIGLRYINRIDFPERPLRWKKWLAVSLPTPSTLEQVGGDFQCHYRNVLGGNLLCHINLGTFPSPNDSVTSLILDIDVTAHEDVPAEALAEGLERVHRPHRELFEGYLLDKTRDLFNIDS